MLFVQRWRLKQNLRLISLLSTKRKLPWLWVGFMFYLLCHSLFSLSVVAYDNIFFGLDDLIKLSKRNSKGYKGGKRSRRARVDLFFIWF